MNFNEKLTFQAEKIEEVLKAHLPKPEQYDQLYRKAGVDKNSCSAGIDTVVSAMEYSVMAGGKRLRPMLMEQAFSVFYGEEFYELPQEAPERILLESFMSALEMIHTYSLVHDDLPAMDNDEYRRGRKTTHVVYGPGMATLAGDGLLNYAFETALSSAAASSSLPPYDGNLESRYLTALQVLAGKAGVYGMVGGQCADIEAEGKKDIRGEDLLFIHEFKTAAMIESGLMIGGILGGANAEQVKMLEQIGHNVGVSFQIQDDILDVIGDEAALGKPVGSDASNEKTTYITLYGLDKAKADVARYLQDAMDLLSQIEGSSKNSESMIFLKGLIQSLVDRKK